MVQVLFAPVEGRSFFPPEQAYEYDAGFDVFAAENRVFAYREIVLIRLGFKMALPPEYEAQLRPRSSIAGTGVTIPNSPATIDAGYRNEVCVLLQNLSNEMRLHRVCIGDKIAQMVIQRVPLVEPQIVEADDLPPSERGMQGFGSSGDRSKEEIQMRGQLKWHA